MASLTHNLWKDVCHERTRLFDQGDQTVARIKTEVAALALTIMGIAESIFQGAGALLGLWVCFIPSNEEWKRTCFTWIEKSTIALEKSLVTTCCCVVQLYTNLWEDKEDQTLENAQAALQECLSFGC